MIKNTENTIHIFSIDKHYHVQKRLISSLIENKKFINVTKQLEDIADKLNLNREDIFEIELDALLQEFEAMYGNSEKLSEYIKEEDKKNNNLCSIYEEEYLRLNKQNCIDLLTDYLREKTEVFIDNVKLLNNEKRNYFSLGFKSEREWEEASNKILLVFVKNNNVYPNKLSLNKHEQFIQNLSYDMYEKYKSKFTEKDIDYFENVMFCKLK